MSRGHFIPTSAQASVAGRLPGHSVSLKQLPSKSLLMLCLFAVRAGVPKEWLVWWWWFSVSMYSAGSQSGLVSVPALVGMHCHNHGVKLSRVLICGDSLFSLQLSHQIILHSKVVYMSVVDILSVWV